MRLFRFIKVHLLIGTSHPIHSNLPNPWVLSTKETQIFIQCGKLHYKKSTGEPEQKKELLKKIKEITTHRTHLDSSVSMIEGQLLADRLIEVRGDGMALVDDWDCLKSMVRTYETHCGSLTQYGMKHTRSFANVFNSGVIKEKMDEVARTTCSSYTMGKWDPAIVGYSA
ncbi:peptidase C13, legumain [Artemisia annua]|uniref:Peptidase C13, legumain n=1 Tax=Artemisia annua TaxID=35608 RepID=A0A2U1LKV9_ARTAN|nr:peptidase C13, legumain [Artemisia annua]